MIEPDKGHQARKDGAGLALMRQASPVFRLEFRSILQAAILLFSMTANPANPLPSSRKLDGSGTGGGGAS